MLALIALISSAVAATCPDGQVVVHRKGHCCWPGQTWSRAKKRCAGIPRECPEGWSVHMPMHTASQPPVCANLTELDGVAGSTMQDFTIAGGPRTHGSVTPLTDHLSFHDPVLMGTLDRTLADGVLIEHGTSLGRCAKQAVDLGLAGTIEMKFTVNKTGAVVKADVKAESLGHAATGACLAEVLGSLTFPPPSGGGVVVASYLFAIGSRPQAPPYRP